MSLGLRFGARSDVGLLRSGNEDAMYAGPRLLAVADGMGGHAAGEVASRIAIEAIAPLDLDLPGSDLITALRDAVETANNYIRDMVAADSALEGMGTTLTALLSAGQRLGLVHVGDSRAYLLRDGALHQITHDHTLVQSLVDEGRITPEEATTHPQRSWITRALDGRNTIELDLSVREARPGDRYLLCSDGLTGVVSEETVTEALQAPDPQEACDRLVELALRGGGPDNITCIVADVVEQADDDRPIVGGSAAGTAAVSPDGALDDTPASRAAAIQPRPAPPAPAVDDDDSDVDDVERRGRRNRRRLLVVAAATVLVLAGAVGGTAVVLRHQFYIAPTKGAAPTVAVYRGVTGSVLGIDLSHIAERSDLPVSAIPEPDQSRVRDGITAKDRADADRILASLRTDVCTLARQQAAATAKRTHKPAPALPAYCQGTS